MANRLALAVSAAVLLLILPLARTAQADRAKRTRCANNLRMLGLAAASYAGDKRFYPHLGGLRELDGDVTTSDTPRTLRMLMYFGYLDEPKPFVCPESYDDVSPDVPDDRRGWFWGGNTLRQTHTSPVMQPKVGDPPLNATTELSYGWTRRAYNCNAASRSRLGADRAVNEEQAVNTPLAGNHADGWNVVHVDAATKFHPVVAKESNLGALLVAAGKNGDGYLAIKPQPEAINSKPFHKPRSRPGKLQLPKRKAKETK